MQTFENAKAATSFLRLPTDHRNRAYLSEIGGKIAMAITG